MFIGMENFFKYFYNGAKIRDRSIVVQISVIKTHFSSLV